MPAAVLLAGLEHLGQPGEVSFALQDHRVRREVTADLINAAVEDALAVIDEHDPVAERLHLIHLVSRHDHGTSGGHLLLDDLLDQPGVDGVESREGLVDDYEVGLVQQSGDDLGLLLHALAELLHLLAPVLIEVHAFEPGDQPALRFTVAEALERGEEDQHLLERDVLVEAAVLGQITDAVLGDLGGIRAQYLHASGIGLEDVEHHADGGGLAGAVGTEEAEHLARLNLERYVLHGPGLTEGFAQMFDHH